MTESAPLSEDELMALWERGRRIALARCSHSLRALRQGGGGFYEADDLWQDLFLDFMELARRGGTADPLRGARRTSGRPGGGTCGREVGACCGAARNACGADPNAPSIQGRWSWARIPPRSGPRHRA